MAASPDQIIALQTINGLKETISEWVAKCELAFSLALLLQRKETLVYLFLCFCTRSTRHHVQLQGLCGRPRSQPTDELPRGTRHQPVLEPLLQASAGTERIPAAVDRWQQAATVTQLLGPVRQEFPVHVRVIASIWKQPPSSFLQIK